MSALDNILEDHIINTYDGSSDYLGCCGGVVEFGERHHTETCGLIEARAELAELRERLDKAEKLLFAAMPRIDDWDNLSESIHDFLKGE